MEREEKFGNIHDRMNFTYSSLDNLMADLWKYLQENPSDEMVWDILRRLGVIGENIIYAQKDLTSAYCKDDFKDGLLNNLDSKLFALRKAREDSMRAYEAFKQSQEYSMNPQAELPKFIDNSNNIPPIPDGMDPNDRVLS